MPKIKDVVDTHLILDFDVCAVKSTQRKRAVEHELHVAGTRSLLACQGYLLRYL